MNKKNKNVYDKLNVITINRDDYNMILKDRLDFGFDSIYFRYSEAIDELAAYMSKVDHIDPIEARRRLSHRKMHFYNALEQLVHAHEEEDK